MLYILTSVCVLGTPNASKNLHFNIFCSKKMLNRVVYLCIIFYSMHSVLSWALFLWTKHSKKTGVLSLDHYAGRRFYSQKVKNEDFDQRLECAAPKPWSKYTTCMITQNFCIKDPFFKRIEIVFSVILCTNSKNPLVV